MHLSPLLTAILERARHAPPAYVRAVATDADGTLWDGDVGDALFLHLAARGLLRGEGLESLRAHARRIAGPSLAEQDGGTIARTLYALYERGEIDVRVMCNLEAEAVGDRPVADLTALIDEVAVQLAPRARPEVRELLRAARAEGFAVHVVTGSLGIAVEATLRWAEIPFDRVAGGVLRVDGDFARATMARTCPLFEGKVDALREGGQWPAAIGLGDGGWDHTFLRQVHVPVLVHPKPALETAMQDVLHAVVLRATA